MDATGDGTTDDTDAIQATIDAVPASGGTVFFPVGDYLITSSLLVERPWVTLEGANTGFRSIVYDAEGKGAKIKATTAFDMLVLHTKVDANYRNAGIVVRNLQIRGNDRAGASKGIYIYGDLAGKRASDWVLLDNIAVINCGTGVYTDNTDATTIVDSWISENGRGIYEEDSIHMTIRGCVIADNDGKGIEMLRTKRSLVQGNQFARNTYSVHMTTCDRVSIGDNIIYAATADGVYATDCDYVSIRGNQTTDCTSGSGIAIGGGSNYCAVVGNEAIGNRYGIVTFGAANNGNVISGNACHLNTRNGIYLQGSVGGTITGNSVAENSQETNVTYDNIILLGESDYNTLQGNVVRKGAQTNKPRYGIRVDAATCDGNWIVNNDLYTAGQTANISDAGTGTDTTTTGNRV